MESIMRTPGLKKKIFGVIAAETLVLVGIAAVVSYQVRLVEQKITDMADLKDPSPFTATLVSYLGQINLHLIGYQQNRGADELRNVVDNEKSFETSISDFQKLYPKLFPTAAQDRIIDAYQPLKTSVQKTIETVDAQAAKWDEQISNDDKIVFLLEHRLRPLVRDRQTYATQRADLISNLENEVRAIPRDLTQYLFKHSESPEASMSLNDKKFETLVKIYQRIAPLAVERKALLSLDGLWSDNMTLAQEITGLEKTKAEAFSQMVRSNQQVQSTISTVLPAVRPEVIEEKKNAILRSITWIAVTAGLMVLVGLVTSILTGLWLYRRIRRSFDAVTRVAEAAAQGDFSGQVEGETARQLGGMASAVNQLIGNMRRSEEMIVQLGSMVESSGDAAIGMNLDGVILSWNRNAERIYGYGSQEVRGKSIAVLFAAERLQEVGLIHEKLRESKKITFDTLHIRKNGSIFRAHLIVHRIIDTSGQTIGISLLSRELPHVTDASPTNKPNNLAA